MDTPFYLRNDMLITTDSAQRCTSIDYRDPSFPLVLFHNKFDSRIAICHWHPEIELVVVRKGSLIFHLTGSQYHIREGEGFFVNSNILHFMALDPGVYDTIIFGFACLPQLIAAEGTLLFHKYLEPVINQPQYAFLHLKPDCDWQRSILSKILQMEPWLAPDKDLAEIVLRNQISDIWTHLYKNRESFAQKKPVGRRHTSFLRLNQMCSYIQANYAKPLLIDDIARAASISKSEAIRCFKEGLSLTPYQYLIDCRIMIAKSLIAITNDSILSIALQCGFNNGSHFSHCFRQKVGMLPSEYRKLIQADTGTIQEETIPPIEG